MAIDATKNIKTDGFSLDPAATQEVDREEIKRLAEQFEAILMTQMLREMRRSMLDEEEQENGFGAGPLTDTGDVELGQALSRAGGLGLSESLLRAFEKQVATRGPAGSRDAHKSDGSDGSAAAGEVDNARGPGGLDETGAAPLVVAAPISGQFGWRRDPFSGAARFHHGVDIAVAYGREVKAAAAGVVTFAGVQKGYGNTVIIDHESGRQTRYAHLSEQLVRSGDVVAEGQVVAKSGNSGRSTGPHLHFEVLVNGRPVDPMRPL